MQRIDKAIRPPGLIRSAKTYSLFFDTDRFYAIVTGPAGMKVGNIATFGIFSGAVTKAIKKPIEDGFAKAYGPKVTAGEERLTIMALPELAKEKYSMCLPFSDITSVIVGTDAAQGPYLQLITAKEKIKFLFRDKTQAEIETLARNFGREVVVK